MERRIAENGTVTTQEPIATSLDVAVDLQACGTAVDPVAYDDEDLHEGVTSGVGAATALEQAADADIQLLVWPTRVRL